jgi:adenylate kinase
MPDSPISLLIIAISGGGKHELTKRFAKSGRTTHVEMSKLIGKNPTAQAHLRCGRFLEDDEIETILREELPQIEQDVDYIIFDGLGRTEAQMRSLPSILRESCLPSLTAVIYIEVPDDVANERMLKRAELARQAGETPREDDLCEIARAQRILNFHELVIPAIAAVQKYGTPLITIDGTKTPDEIFHEASSKVFQYLLAYRH